MLVMGMEWDGMRVVDVGHGEMMGAGHVDEIHRIEDDGCWQWVLVTGMGSVGWNGMDASNGNFMGRKQQIPALLRTPDSTTPPGDTGTPNPPQFELQPLSHSLNQHLNPPRPPNPR